MWQNEENYWKIVYTDWSVLKRKTTEFSSMKYQQHINDGIFIAVEHNMKWGVMKLHNCQQRFLNCSAVHYMEVVYRKMSLPGMENVLSAFTTTDRIHILLTCRNNALIASKISLAEGCNIACN